MSEDSIVVRTDQAGAYVMASDFLDCEINEPARVGRVRVTGETWKPLYGFNVVSYIVVYADGTHSEERHRRSIVTADGNVWIAPYDETY